MALRRTSKRIAVTDVEDAPISEFQEQQKQRCQKCKKLFVDLEKHKICRAKGAASSDCSAMGSESDTSLLSTEGEESNAIKTQKCLNLKRKFVSCSTCQATFKSQQVLSLHKYAAHDQQKSVDKEFKTPQSKQQCLQCKKLYVDLEKHVICRGKKTMQNQVLSDNLEAHLSDSSTEKTPIKIRRSLRSDSSTSFNNYVTGGSEDFQKHLTRLKNYYLSPSDAVEIDPLFEKLKSYVDFLLPRLDNVVTEKLSQEVADTIDNVDLIGAEKRTMVLTKEQATRLNNLNDQAKQLKFPASWTWGAKDSTNRGKYNNERLKLCIEKELNYKVVHCKNCGSTGVLTGIEQLALPQDQCYMCSTKSVTHRSNQKAREERFTTKKKKVPTATLR